LSGSWDEEGTTGVLSSLSRTAAHETQKAASARATAGINSAGGTQINMQARRTTGRAKTAMARRLSEATHAIVPKAAALWVRRLPLRRGCQL
jgi:hypothetical protein